MIEHNKVETRDRLNEYIDPDSVLVYLKADDLNEKEKKFFHKWYKEFSLNSTDKANEFIDLIESRHPLSAKAFLDHIYAYMQNDNLVRMKCLQTSSRNREGLENICNEYKGHTLYRNAIF